MFGKARLKLTLWYAGALALVLGVVGGVTYVTVRQALDADVSAALRVAEASLLAPNQGGRGGPGPPDQGRIRQPLQPDGEHPFERGPGSIASDVFYMTTNADGVVISNPRRISLDGIDFVRLTGNTRAGNRWSDIAAEGKSYRFLSSESKPSNGAEPVYLHVGKSLDDRNDTLSTITQLLLLGGLSGLVLAAGGGYWVAGRTLDPIRRALETQRQFVSDASHELRTPIAAIQANNELLALHPRQTIGDNLDQVEAVATETAHMTRLVEDMLTIARADEGRLALAEEAVALDELAQAITRDLAPLAESKGLKLVCEPSPAIVAGDSARLRQLALILVDNAIKYTPGGGTVTVSSRRTGRRAELSVSDTGPGIAPEFQARIFDRFYRADAARAQDGTGLGLAIARIIAEAHEGSIAVQSAVGRGSTFTVRLPVA